MNKEKRHKTWQDWQLATFAATLIGMSAFVFMFFILANFVNVKINERRK